MTLLIAGVVLVSALGLVLAVFPPRDVPRWWRRATRPLRRLVRPRHYKAW
jgi:preprotein translocase subunit Sec63